MKRVKAIFLNEQNKYLKNGMGIVFATLGVLILGVCLIHGLGDDIWYDEVFSVRFMEHSYREIVTLTAKDVHPPMYYWYLKLFHDIGKWMIPSASSIVLCKMASLLPFVGIYVYGLTLVRKRFGFEVTGIFLFFVSAMPQITNYTIEIRMYALALFLITAVFLHGYELIAGNKGKVHWVFFWLFGILTAYTQYYACIAIVAIYMAMFVFFLLQKEKRMLGGVLLCAGLSVLAYLPWIPSFIRQVNAVSNSYWIQPLTFRSIFGCIKHVFLPVSGDVTKNYILAVMMIGVFGISFICSFFKNKEPKHRYVLLCGIFVPIFTAFMGFVCSALNRPIFVYRYLIPCLGAMWLVAAYSISDSFGKNWGILLLIPFLLAGHSNMGGFRYEENKKIVEMESTKIFMDAFPEDAAVLCNFDHVQALSAYYLKAGNPVYLYGGEPESLIQELLPGCQGFADVEQLKELVETEDVYFFGSFNSREDLLEEWAADGIGYEEEGTYLLERYYFNVYHLSIAE